MGRRSMGRGAGQIGRISQQFQLTIITWACQSLAGYLRAHVYSSRSRSFSYCSIGSRIHSGDILPDVVRADEIHNLM